MSHQKHPQRDYVDGDFPKTWKKADYVAIVQRQLSSWPNTEAPFSPSRTSIADIKRVLKDSSTQFKTSNPLPTAQALVPGYGIALNSSKHAKTASTQPAVKNNQIETHPLGMSTSDATLVSITLLITDKRSDEVSCVSQEIIVAYIDNFGCKPNEVRVRSRDVFNALQNTPARLE
ncbi:hypothetical protein FB446DRAFT_710093, partial [Lentinula raphanica]